MWARIKPVRGGLNTNKLQERVGETPKGAEEAQSDEAQAGWGAAEIKVSEILGAHPVLALHCVKQ